MGHKSVCTNCRKAYSNFLDKDKHIKEVCPECGTSMYFVNQMFKPPKKTEIKKWKVVKYLLENGFDYNHIYEMLKPGVYRYLGKYPENMKAAEEFVKNFHSNGVKK